MSRGPFSPKNCGFFKSKRYLIAVDFFFPSYVYVGSAAFSVGAIKLSFFFFFFPAMIRRTFYGQQICSKSSSLKIK